MSTRRWGPALTRRELLSQAALWGTGLLLVQPRSLYAALGERAEASATSAPKARAAIEIWMSGGPCHVDTFDPKPGAGYEVCGPLRKPIATNVAGIQIGELMPQLAQQADKYSLIRSMTHGVNAHETASYRVQTGHKPGSGAVHPCLGSVVSLYKGHAPGSKSVIPPYVALTTPLGRFSEAGFLGEQYAPFATGGDPAQKKFAVEGIVAGGMSDKRLADRRALLSSLDSLGHAMSAQPQFRRFEQCEREAAETVAQAAKLFDLTLEKDAIRERYGRNTFGQSCLMARRLVENGVPYVQINYPGWDTHKQHFQTMNRKLPELDRGLAALLSDLSERGLLASTVVWCSGEFGRTPKVQWQPPWNGGRGHHGECFSALIAGGGFKGGHVVGASDDAGERVAERPVYPEDLLGSICQMLGIDPEAQLPNDRGLNEQVMPPAETGKGRLVELM